MAKKKNTQDIAVVPPELTITPELQTKVDELLQASHKEVKTFWDEKITNYLYVPVEGGEIRVIHVKPENPKNKRPIIHIPGWGVTQLGFNVLYEVLHEDIEFYYIETREKGTSKIKRCKADMSIHQKARDIAHALKHLGLEGTDFVVFSPCWGATILIEGIRAKILDIPNIVAIDPMHRLWFNRVLLNISPIIPAFIATMIKPIIRFFAFMGMKEKAQLERNKEFVRNAVVWKWKRAGYLVKDLELYGTLGDITQEVLVFNGTSDKVHEQSDYPKMAKELPEGRFFFMKTHESNRERLQAVIMKEFALADAKEKVPSTLVQFEKKLIREPPEEK